MEPQTNTPCCLRGPFHTVSLLRPTALLPSLTADNLCFLLGKKGRPSAEQFDLCLPHLPSYCICTSTSATLAGWIPPVDNWQQYHLLFEIDTYVNLHPPHLWLPSNVTHSCCLIPHYHYHQHQQPLAIQLHTDCLKLPKFTTIWLSPTTQSLSPWNLTPSYSDLTLVPFPFHDLLVSFQASPLFTLSSPLDSKTSDCKHNLWVFTL